jgi:hypothetical protein
MRGSNQIAALNELREKMASPQVQLAERLIRDELPDKLKDHAFRYHVATPLARPDEVRDIVQKINTIANFYEGVGVLVKARLVDPTLALDMWSARFAMHWEVLAPVVAILRREWGIGLWENFEYLAVLSEEWRSKHPHGNYPPRTRRITLGDHWLGADAQYASDLANGVAAPRDGSPVRSEASATRPDGRRSR